MKGENTKADALIGGRYYDTKKNAVYVRVGDEWIKESKNE